MCVPFYSSTSRPRHDFLILMCRKRGQDCGKIIFSDKNPLFIVKTLKKNVTKNGTRIKFIVILLEL